MEDIDLRRDVDSGEYEITFVGVGGGTASMSTAAPVHLGFGFRPSRRGSLVWDLAFGYVSGFPVSAIAWFILTRTLAPDWLVRKILAWEKRTGRHDPTIRWVPVGEPRSIHNLSKPHNQNDTTALAEGVDGGK